MLFKRFDGIFRKPPNIKEGVAVASRVAPEVKQAAEPF